MPADFETLEVADEVELARVETTTHVGAVVRSVHV